MRIGTGNNKIPGSGSLYFASQFATEQIQGRPFGVKNAERVPIVKHEDVRRMLLDMKAHVEGIRAMIFKGFYYLDMQANSGDKAKAKKYGEFAGNPDPDREMLWKRSHVGIVAQAIQVLGGVGYTQEYPVEQYLRDSKILTIWEGTSFIHSQDLVGTARCGGGMGSPSRNGWTKIKAFVDRNRNAEGFEKEMEILAKGFACAEEVTSIYNAWFNDMKNEPIP